MPNSSPDFTIASLGQCRFPSPMTGVRFTGDDERVLWSSVITSTGQPRDMR